MGCASSVQAAVAGQPARPAQKQASQTLSETALPRPANATPRRTVSATETKQELPAPPPAATQPAPQTASSSPSKPPKDTLATSSLQQGKPTSPEAASSPPEASKATTASTVQAEAALTAVASSPDPAIQVPPELECSPQQPSTPKEQIKQLCKTMLKQQLPRFDTVGRAIPAAGQQLAVAAASMAAEQLQGVVYDSVACAQLAQLLLQAVTLLADCCCQQKHGQLDHGFFTLWTEAMRLVQALASKFQQPQLQSQVLGQDTSAAPQAYLDLLQLFLDLDSRLRNLASQVCQASGVEVPPGLQEPAVAAMGAMFGVEEEAGIAEAADAAVAQAQAVAAAEAAAAAAAAAEAAAAEAAATTSTDPEPPHAPAEAQDTTAAPPESSQPAESQGAESAVPAEAAGTSDEPPATTDGAPEAAATADAPVAEVDPAAASAAGEASSPSPDAAEVSVEHSVPTATNDNSAPAAAPAPESAGPALLPPAPALPEHLHRSFSAGTDLRGSRGTILVVCRTALKITMPKLDDVPEALPAAGAMIHALNFFFTRAQTVQVQSPACRRLCELVHDGLAELLVGVMEAGRLEGLGAESLGLATEALHDATSLLGKYDDPALAATLQADEALAAAHVARFTAVDETLRAVIVGVAAACGLEGRVAERFVGGPYVRAEGELLDPPVLPAAAGLEGAD